MSRVYRLHTSINVTYEANIFALFITCSAESTVFIIAHRINTVLDCDKIIVLINGEIAEFDTPSNLLAKQDGIFRSMVEKSRSKDE